MKKQLLIAVMALLGVSGASAYTRTTTWDFTTLETIGDATSVTTPTFTFANAFSADTYTHAAAETATISGSGKRTNSLINQSQYTALTQDGFDFYIGVCNTSGNAKATFTKGTGLVFGESSSNKYLTSFVINNVKAGDKITVTFSGTLAETNGVFTDVLKYTDSSDNTEKAIKWKSNISSGTTYTIQSDGYLILRATASTTVTNISIVREMKYTLDFSKCSWSTSSSTALAVSQAYGESYLRYPSNKNDSKVTSPVYAIPADASLNMEYYPIRFDNTSIYYSSDNSIKSVNLRASNTYMFINNLKKGDVLNIVNKSSESDYKNVYLRGGSISYIDDSSVKQTKTNYSDQDLNGKTLTVEADGYVCFRFDQYDRIYSITITPAAAPTAANQSATAGSVIWGSGETYTTNVETGKYSTVCLPYAATVEGATVLKLIDKSTDASGNVSSLTFTYAKEGATTDAESYELAAGMPYLIRATANEQVYTRSNTTAAAVSSVTDANGFTGVYTATTIGDSEYFLYTNTTSNSQYFAMSDGTVTAGAFKAYIKSMADVNTVATSGNAKKFILSPSFKPTAINQIDAADVQVVGANGKFFQNGKLVIVKNGRQYNAAGAQVK